MARIKIGNIKGPAGPKGATGATGPIGPVGPKGPLPPLTNNGLATVVGVSALDAVYGKKLTDDLASLNSDLNTGLSKKANTEDLNANKSGRMATGNIIVGTDFHQIRLQVENASQANKTLAVYDNDTKGIIGYIDFDR